MKYRMIAVAIGALTLAGCGQQRKSETQANAPAAESAAQTHSGAGKVTAITGDQVSISHGRSRASAGRR